MKPHLASLIAALGLVACPSAPVPVATPDPKTPAGVDEALAPLTPRAADGGSTRPPYERHQLDNGLEVWLFPDHGAPLAIVQVWVDVGSADEHERPAGKDHGITGLSHFFEHLMFQGTKKYPEYDEALNPLGARNNAFTYHDATAYWVYTPKEHLRFVLDIEADRFQHMKVDFVHLEPEREVVKSERRQSVDGDPAAIADERATRNAFDRQPYKWGPIGWLSDLDAITLEEAQAYHAAHYHPGGTRLVIVGDFDPTATLAWVRELWGSIPAGPTGPDKPDRPAPEPETWVGPRTDHIVEDAPATKVVWAFRVPGPREARAYAALEIVDYVLTNGKAGRLQRGLVFSDAPKLSQLGASLFPLRDPYLYTWHADLLDGVSVGSVEAALDAEFQAIARDGVSADELQRAVASLRIDIVRQSLGLSDRADAIGFSLRSTGAPLSHLDRLDLYPTITADEIKQAAATWLVPAMRSRVVVVTPGRLVALTAAWEESLPGLTMQGNLEAAARWFVAHEQHRRAVADADREERAIAMLAQRADTAKAATKDRAERAAIDKYLSENTSGTVKRRRALAATRKELAPVGTALEKERKRIAAAIDRLDKASAVMAPRAGLAAAKLLVTPPGGLAIPLPPDEIAVNDSGAQALALQAVSAWVLEANGLVKSAQDARAFVLRSGPRFVGDAASPLVRLAFELAHDTSAEGRPLVDRPDFSVRRQP